MAKQKKVKKGDKKRVSELDSALDQNLRQGASSESYESTPAPKSQPYSTEQAQPPASPRKKYVKETLFPRKVMALFTEEQYQELSELVMKMRQRDGKLHTLNSLIRDAVARIVNDFRLGR